MIWYLWWSIKMDEIGIWPIFVAGFRCIVGWFGWQKNCPRWNTCFRVFKLKVICWWWSGDLCKNQYKSCFMDYREIIIEKISKTYFFWIRSLIIWNSWENFNCWTINQNFARTRNFVNVTWKQLIVGLNRNSLIISWIIFFNRALLCKSNFSRKY